MWLQMAGCHSFLWPRNVPSFVRTTSSSSVRGSMDASCICVFLAGLLTKSQQVGTNKCPAVQDVPFLVGGYRSVRTKDEALAHAAAGMNLPRTGRGEEARLGDALIVRLHFLETSGIRNTHCPGLERGGGRGVTTGGSQWGDGDVYGDG